MNISLEQLNGLFHRQHFGQVKETGLHDHVDAVTKPHFTGNFYGINIIEIQLFVMDGFPHAARDVFFHVFQRPFGVQQEGAAGFDAFEHIVELHVIGLMNRHKIRILNQVGGTDGAVAEPQMGNGDAAGFFGIIGKVALGIFIGVVADDGNGGLIGPHSPVGTQAEEFGGYGAFRGRAESGAHFQ